MSDPVVATPRGLYCPAGDFCIDPWQPVWDSPYGAGRQRGAWWKWKIDPLVFDGVMIAVRFPRILRWRHDKPAAEADRLADLKQVLAAHSGGPERRVS